MDNHETSLVARIFNLFIIFMIILSTAACVIETMPEFRENPVFFPLEMCITAIFSVEFALRLYACHRLLSFVVDPYNIIDFAAIVPGFFEIAFLLASGDSGSKGEHLEVAGSMRTLRMIRLIRLVRVTRVMRLVKVARYSKLLGIILAVFWKVAQSGLMVIVFLMGFAMILSASLVYLVESEACEETGLHCTGPSAFVSIPSGFWWAIATLTTVGYGDMVPHTPGGKVIGGLTSVMGVVCIAIGIAVVSINFRDCYVEEKTKADLQRRSAAEKQHAVTDEVELDELTKAFEERSKALLEKLRHVSSQRDSAEQFQPLLDMLTTHIDVFSFDAKSLAGLVGNDSRREAAPPFHSDTGL